MLDKLKKMAYEEKSPFGMVELALIYCGEADNQFLALNDPEINAIYGTDFSGGLNLIDSAMEIIQTEGDTLVCTQYSRLANLCRTIKNKWNIDGEREMYIRIVSNQHTYEELALNSMENNNGGLTPAEIAASGGIPKEAIELQRQLVAATKAELDDTLALYKK